MENRSYGDVMGNSKAPYLNSLAAQCRSLTHARAITHPSAPNYLGATSGIPVTQLPASDCTNCRKSGPSIFTQGLSWRSYQESMTTNCRLSPDSAGEYVVRHNPATYLLAARAGCQANDVPYSTLAADLSAHGLAQFTFITPNLAHDMHDGGVAAGDAWLAAELPRLVQRSEYQNGSTVIFIMWDEGSGGGSLKGVDCASSTSASCHVPLLVLRANLPSGPYLARVSHYDVLATTEQLLGVPVLGSGTPQPLAH
jgi:hypothetical protein